MNAMKLFRTYVLFPALILLAQPGSVLACSTCYGDPSAPMSKGLVWGIGILLGVVGTVLAGVAMFFVHVARNSPPTPPDGSVE